MNKKVMICGAGLGQVDAIIRAKALGFSAYVVDQNPNAIGVKYSDHFEAIDIKDYEKCLDFAKRYKIDGILTLQSDLAIPTVGYINDYLGLVGISNKTAMYCSNKTLMRDAFNSNGVSQPHFIKVGCLEAALKACNQIGLPCVVKAPISSGSRGVIKLTNLDDLAYAFNEAMKYSNSEVGLIVEEFISGKEYGAQTFSIDGKCEIVLVHDDYISDPPYMIPIGHSLPSEMNSDVLLKAQVEIKKSVEALGIMNGPANVDFIIDKYNNVKIIEIGARVGATCLPELIFHHTGYNWIDAAILSCLGLKIDFEFSKSDFVSAYILTSPKDGIFLGYNESFTDVYKHNVLEFEVSVKVGDTVSTFKKGTDRIGKIVIKADSISSANSIYSKILKLITFNIK